MEDRIIIGFSRAKGFKPLSWFIMLFEGTPFSHVYIKTYNNYFEQYDIFQASKGYVNHITEDSFLLHNHKVNEFVFPISTLGKKDLLMYLRNRLGRPYSLKSLFILFLSKLGMNLTRFSDGESSYICSELAARTINYSNIIYLDRDLDLITPKELYKILNDI